MKAIPRVSFGLVPICGAFCFVACAGDCERQGPASVCDQTKESQLSLTVAGDKWHVVSQSMLEFSPYPPLDPADIAFLWHLILDVQASPDCKPQGSRSCGEVWVNFSWHHPVVKGERLVVAAGTIPSDLGNVSSYLDFEEPFIVNPDWPDEPQYLLDSGTVLMEDVSDDAVVGSFSLKFVPNPSRADDLRQFGLLVDWIQIEGRLECVPGKVTWCKYARLQGAVEAA